MAINREDKFRTHRIIQIDKKIRSGEYPTVKEIMDEYGISRRTVMRDFEFLRDRYDAPLEYDINRNGYYYTDPTFMVQNVLLTEGDLFAVSTLMPLMEEYKNTPLEAAFKNIMSKLSEMLPRTVSVDTSFINNDISFIKDPAPEISEDIFNNVFKAVKTHQVLEFEYKSGTKQQFSHKSVDCYQVICQKGTWYVFCYDRLNKDYRVFAFHRMKNLFFTGEIFVIPAGFKLEDYIDLSFGVWTNGDIIEYELLFEPAVSNYILERVWHNSQVIETLDDGSVVLKFRSNQKQQVKSWVLGFGNAVTVLNPAEFKDDIKNELKKNLEKYN